MGLGRFNNGKFDVIVVANFTLDTATADAWQRSFSKASELLWDASEGQFQFGRIYVCDDSIGLDTADFILYDSGDPSFASGTFGAPGAAMHLMPYVRNQPLTTLHELGHYAWDLGEEYAAEPQFDLINTSVTPANNSTIPLQGATISTATLTTGSAILRFAGSLERRTITAATATSLTVSPPFSQSPVNDTDGWVQYQFAAECATSSTSRFCIMERSRSAAGEFDASGTWVPAANPVVEFCSASNHDPDNDTHQDDKHGESCWDQIVDIAGFTGFTAPDPATAGPTNFTAPDWIDLDKQPRFAVCVDRSGSMSGGNKMADAQHGATYWLEFCAVSDDQLSVIGYDNLIDPVFGLAPVSSLGDLSDEVAAIDALFPRGGTNIRDALFEAQSQITSVPTRSAVQVTLLLTDGRHNTPSGSSPSEVVDSFREDGIRVYSLGVGEPGAVSMSDLDAVSDGTGGRAYAVGDNDPGAIEAAMIEINAEVRGGIIATSPVPMPDAGRSNLDKVVEDEFGHPAERGTIPADKRLPLEQVLELLKVDPGELIAGQSGPVVNERVAAVYADVEVGAARASFTISHGETADYWLYLIDPSGGLVEPAAPGVHHVTSDAPHEFVIVDGPEPGRWTMVAVRIDPGSAGSLRFVAGAENRRLQAFGRATGSSCSLGVAMLHASARFNTQLTGLSVTARVVDPAGHERMVRLTDDRDAQRPASGQYEAAYVPTRNGRHTGVITIRGSASSTIADPLTLMRHLDPTSDGDGEGRDDLSTKVDGTPWVRHIPFSFHVGPEGVKDVGERPFEQDRRPPGRRPIDWPRPWRPTDLTVPTDR